MLHVLFVKRLGNINEKKKIFNDEKCDRWVSAYFMERLEKVWGACMNI